jgi:hypothetical protein
MTRWSEEIVLSLTFMDSSTEKQQEIPQAPAVRVNHAPHPKKTSKKEKTQEHVGAPYWGTASQVAYLTDFVEDFLCTAARSKQRKELIKKISILFFTKYGWDWEDNTESEEPDPDDSDMAALSKALDGSSNEETDERAKTLTEFREVTFDASK